MKTPKMIRTSVGTALPYGTMKGIWLWNALIITNNPDSIIDLCYENHINTIYVSWNNNVTREQYQTFIGKAYRRGIFVHALAGDPTWALDAYSHICSELIDQVHNYNVSVSHEERFTAIQLDVEPHGLNGTNGYPNNWNDDKAGTIAQWVRNSDKWLTQVREYQTVLGGAFVFWLGGELPPAEYAPKTLEQVMLDKYDYFAIMAYRDSLAEITNVTNGVMNYATARKVVVGIETTDQTPASITFFQEGFNTAEKAIQDIHDTYKGKAGYAGVAIHDYYQWEQFTRVHMAKLPKQIKTPYRTMGGL